MNRTDRRLAGAIAGVLALATTELAGEPRTETEMCFNYRLENSCGANANGCGGSALGRIACGAHPDRYRYPGRWMVVPKGSCEQVYGGSLLRPATDNIGTSQP